MAKQESSDQYRKLLDDVIGHVRNLKEEGVQTVEVENHAGTSSPNPGNPPGAAPASVVSALQEIARRVAQCKACPLCKSRNKTVPGQGSPAPEILFIGEGPGAEEDRQGLAFVGAAGQLLTKIIQAMGFTRDQVFIGNVVKCRPPENRTPMPDEMKACLPYLQEQIALLKPKIIVAMGATAVRGLLDVETGITRLRGRWLSYEGIDLMPTFHPAYLLRNPAGKKDVWEDMKSVLARLGRKPPARTK